MIAFSADVDVVKQLGWFTMLIIVLFGLGMFALGAIMFLKPMAFSNSIATFSHKTWFHHFEIVSRLLIGVLFLLFAKQTSYPTVITVLGIILCFVSVFLVLIGEQRHKRFALRTARIGKHFRPLGLIAILCGASLIYIGSS